MNPTPRLLVVLLLGLTSILLAPGHASAAPFVVPKSALQPPQVTFSEVANNTSLSGLTINGFNFNQNIALLRTGPSAPPGDTNNTAGQIARGLFGGGHVLTVTFAAPVTAFGFGFWVSVFNDLNAVTVTIFDGATNLGSLVFAGTPDPVRGGGFAGIGNATAFTRAEIRFDPSVEEVAADNFSAIPAGFIVPEGGNTLLLAALGGLAVALFGAGMPASRCPLGVGHAGSNLPRRLAASAEVRLVVVARWAK